jgi:hypothetical protein
MNTVLIYSIGKKLCLHSERVIRNGKLEVFDKEGGIFQTIPVVEQDYKSVILDLEPGVYKVRFKDNIEVVEKETFIGQ